MRGEVTSGGWKTETLRLGASLMGAKKDNDAAEVTRALCLPFKLVVVAKIVFVGTRLQGTPVCRQST